MHTGPQQHVLTGGGDQEAFDPFKDIESATQKVGGAWKGSESSCHVMFGLLLLQTSVCNPEPCSVILQAAEMARDAAKEVSSKVCPSAKCCMVLEEPPSCEVVSALLLAGLTST